MPIYGHFMAVYGLNTQQKTYSHAALCGESERARGAMASVERHRQGATFRNRHLWGQHARGACQAWASSATASERRESASGLDKQAASRAIIWCRFRLRLVPRLAVNLSARGLVRSWYLTAVRTAGILVSARWIMGSGKQKLTVALTVGTRVRLTRLAEQFGCLTVSGGVLQGKPSLTQLFELIGSGEVELRPRTVADDDVAVADDVSGDIVP